MDLHRLVTEQSFNQQMNLRGVVDEKQPLWHDAASSSDAGIERDHEPV
jgi:hypothetical protein